MSRRRSASRFTRQRVARMVRASLAGNGLVGNPFPSADVRDLPRMVASLPGLDLSVPGRVYWSDGQNSGCLDLL